MSKASTNTEKPQDEGVEIKVPTPTEAQVKKKFAYAFTAATIVLPIATVAVGHYFFPSITSYATDFLANRVSGLTNSFSNIELFDPITWVASAGRLAGNSVGIAAFGLANYAWYKTATQISTGRARDAFKAVNDQTNEAYKERQIEKMREGWVADAKHVEGMNRPISNEMLSEFIFCPPALLSDTPRVKAQVLLARRNLDANQQFDAMNKRFKDLTKSLSGTIEGHTRASKSSRKINLNFDSDNLLKLRFNDGLVARNAVKSFDRGVPLSDVSIDQILNANEAELKEIIAGLETDLADVRCNRESLDKNQPVTVDMESDPLAGSMNDARGFEVLNVVTNIAKLTFAPVAIVLHDALHPMPKRELAAHSNDRTPLAESPSIDKKLVPKMARAPSEMYSANAFKII